ncbi:hypothetical protein [Paenibacillus thiaminolyticus]|uniref:hypothetical protein n=1 Tax=Paenibacillus thiaminolyticus TaxID=49283 RepID=UPI002543C2B9|nr:hypothetical protein [Paenibacillus thiaminolyticus]WII38559.1 hypothetical protein O0V01_05370 [Paenibacillus thiaminolyticus]
MVQSKAKNELLSFITADQNPVEFPVSIVWSHAFIFCTLLLFCLLPFILYYVLKYLYENNLKTKKLSSKKYILYAVVFPLGAVLECFAVYIVYSTAPFIPYFMLYQSKGASIIEVLSRKIFLGEPIPEYQILNYEYFKDEVFWSFTLGNLILFGLVGIIVMIRNFTKNKKIGGVKKFLLSLVSSTSLVVVIVIFLTHSVIQMGNLGKNLSQFDIDFVNVKYAFNNNIEEVEGVRIFQKDNYVVVRDKCNIMHYITTSEIHIKILENPPKCK